MFPQMRVNRDPQPVAFPASKVVVHRAPRGKVRGHVAPLATCFHDVEDGVEQLPKGMFARPALFGGLWETVIDQLPFGISQVRCISHPQFVKGCGTTYKLTLKKNAGTFQTGSEQESYDRILALAA